MKKGMVFLLTFLLLSIGCAHPAQPKAPDWESILSGEYTAGYVYDRSCAGAVPVAGLFTDSDDPAAMDLLTTDAKPSSALGKELADISCFRLYIASSQYRADFYEKGILLSELDVSGQPVSSVGLEIGRENYARVLEKIRAADFMPEIFARLYGADLEGLKAVFAAPSTVAYRESWVFSQLGLMKIDKAATREVASDATLPDCFTIDFTAGQPAFASPTAIHIQLTQHEMIVTQAEGTGLHYRFSGSGNTLFAYMQQQYDNSPAAQSQQPNLKPVIYLYPEVETEVQVKLDYAGTLGYTYPTYQNGWDVTAYPDGRLVNKADGSEHYYLFWDGMSSVDWDFSQGFCVAGADTEKFLVSALPQLGLTPREYNDFIVYWLPEMRQNAYNLITFAAQQYEQLAKLTVTPAPDSILRVHMVYRAVNEPVVIAPQQFVPFERTGFTVVEWGGTRAE